MTGRVLPITDEDGLYLEYDAPGARDRTFVFVNALTGATGMWQAEIGPALRAAGYGTLAYNFRGQADSPFAPGTALTQEVIAGDLRRLLDDVQPPRPILVGLSIGGLFAAQAWLAGASADGMVLINTLRRPGPRLEWINSAMARAAALGGTRLVMDMYMPLLVSQERAAQVRPAFLSDAPYDGLPPTHGHANLMAHAVSAEWGFPWERLDLPVLVITGLQDRIFYDAADVDGLAARLPRAQRVDMTDAGHLIPVERPKALIDALLDFGGSL